MILRMPRSTWLSPNINMRDPAMYRILYKEHHRTGDKVVHLSHVRLCPPHRRRAGGHHPLACARWNMRITAPCTTGWWSMPRTCCPAIPAQIEFSPPEPDPDHHVQTLSADAGGERAMCPAGTIPGCPPCAPCAAGATLPPPFMTSSTASVVAKADSTVDLALLEHCVREDLNGKARRAMAVLRSR